MSGRPKTRFCAANHDKDLVGRYPGGSCKACVKRRSHDSWLNHPEIHRNSAYRRLYGIELECYEDLLAKQQLKCAMCSKRSKSLVVDHDHITGKVRGLLCVRCNLRLGLFEDKTFMTLCQNYLGESNVRV
jgi:hypothetical protein